MLFSSVLLTSEPWKETTSCQFFVFNCTTKRPDNETLFLGLFHFCFFPEVRKYLASKELPFKVFFSGGGGGNSHSHPEPHEFRAEGTNVVCCCCWVTSVMSDSVRPQRWQPTRLLRPWDSPGKNTEVGCHFLLQCMKVKRKVKVKSLSRVQLLATPWAAAYQAPPSMGFSRQEYWSGVPLPSPQDL